MISAELAVDTLRAVNHGRYTISKHWTTQREFKQTYASESPRYRKDQQLNDKVHMAYVPHEWINK